MYTRKYIKHRNATAQESGISVQEAMLYNTVHYMSSTVEHRKATEEIKYINILAQRGNCTCRCEYVSRVAMALLQSSVCGGGWQWCINCPCPHA